MGPRFVQLIRGAWINLGIALLVLVLVEGAIQTVFAIRDRGRGDATLIPFERLRAAYPGQHWVEAYHRELGLALREEWHSYVYWRVRSFQGQYINIDKQGLRRTWNGSPSPSSAQPKIFMFGGSTLWGYGARDEFTIPSFVSKKLAGQQQVAPWVVNFGESGYVNTQEVITLILELQKGNVPDIVVFYDGVNDAWAAFQSGEAGTPQNESNRISEFNSRERLNLVAGFVEKLGVFRLTRAMLGTFGRGRAGGQTGLRASDPAVASGVVDVYLGNVRIVEALARAYGFRAVFFWQPTIYSKKVLSGAEDRWRRVGSERGARSGRPFSEEYRFFYDAFRQRLNAKPIESVRDLSGIFEREAGTIFLDRFHVSEMGNEKIADAMVETLRGIAGSVKR